VPLSTLIDFPAQRLIPSSVYLPAAARLPVPALEKPGKSDRQGKRCIDGETRLQPEEFGLL
jgi:hypothetical protein